MSKNGLFNGYSNERYFNSSTHNLIEIIIVLLQIITFIIIFIIITHWRIQSGSGTSQPVPDPNFLSHINEKLKMLKKFQWIILYQNV